MIFSQPIPSQFPTYAKATDKMCEKNLWKNILSKGAGQWPVCHSSTEAFTRVASNDHLVSTHELGKY